MASFSLLVFLFGSRGWDGGVLVAEETGRNPPLDLSQRVEQFFPYWRSDRGGLYVPEGREAEGGGECRLRIEI